MATSFPSLPSYNQIRRIALKPLNKFLIDLSEHSTLILLQELVEGYNHFEKISSGGTDDYD